MPRRRSRAMIAAPIPRLPPVTRAAAREDFVVMQAPWALPCGLLSLIEKCVICLRVSITDPGRFAMKPKRIAAAETPSAVDGGRHQSIARLDLLLSALSEYPETGLRLTEVCRATGLGKATAHRLLSG